jgi:glutamine cyclotransferase
MKVDYTRYLGPFIVVLLVTWTFSCSGRAGEKAESKQPDVALPAAEAAVRIVKLIAPEENAGIKLYDPLNVSFELHNKNKVPDSVLIFFDGKKIATIMSEPWEYTIPSEFIAKTGRKSLKLTAYREGRSQNPITRFIIVYSDKSPKRYGYKVINTYPHDKHAFTQGLIYDKGILFEGTGQTTGSSLREVELKTGKVIRQHNLDVSLFGEGITLYQDRIYQVTWQNRVGFIYDKSTFKTINRVFYNTEGWGLTTLGDRIIMSDGTNILYFIEPEMFTVVSRLEVYDHEKKVDALNELEYINGEIWANMWMSDLIARIDPVSGKVIAYVDLTGILPEPDRNNGAEVLNGIAYDKDGDRIFVTGKNWPKLFEIRITE